MVTVNLIPNHVNGHQIRAAASSQSLLTLCVCSGKVLAVNQAIANMSKRHDSIDGKLSGAVSASVVNVLVLVVVTLVKTP